MPTSQKRPQQRQPRQYPKTVSSTVTQDHSAPTEQPALDHITSKDSSKNFLGKKKGLVLEDNMSSQQLLQVQVQDH